MISKEQAVGNINRIQRFVGDVEKSVRYLNNGCTPSFLLQSNDEDLTRTILHLVEYINYTHDEELILKCKNIDPRPLYEIYNKNVLNPKDKDTIEVCIDKLYWICNSQNTTKKPLREEFVMKINTIEQLAEEIKVCLDSSFTPSFKITPEINQIGVYAKELRAYADSNNDHDIMIRCCKIDRSAFLRLNSTFANYPSEIQSALHDCCYNLFRIHNMALDRIWGISQKDINECVYSISQEDGKCYHSETGEVYLKDVKEDNILSKIDGNSNIPHFNAAQNKTEMGRILQALQDSDFVSKQTTIDTFYYRMTGHGDSTSDRIKWVRVCRNKSLSKVSLLDFLYQISHNKKMEEAIKFASEGFEEESGIPITINTRTKTDVRTKSAHNKNISEYSEQISAILQCD